ncbi:hypothetical protein NDU88_007444 [Pleurodeles waltl]|uniref:Uncharacterized protein n=1 Tax=Pleurodeles waltl TaxID=8319 RepID=A0AAV7SSS9_PLEWA|nr:hypothetical protein NDU88_007444 [Pleurodeles waltl]
MAQSSQKTGYVLIQDGAVVTEDGGGLAPPRSLSPLRLCRTRGRAASVVAVPRSRGSVPGVPRGRGHPLVPARRDSHPRRGDCGSPEAPVRGVDKSVSHARRVTGTRTNADQRKIL